MVLASPLRDALGEIDNFIVRLPAPQRSFYFMRLILAQNTIPCVQPSLARNLPIDHACIDVDVTQCHLRFRSLGLRSYLRAFSTKLLSRDRLTIQRLHRTFAFPFLSANQK